jgi:choline-sulfatase
MLLLAMAAMAAALGRASPVSVPVAARPSVLLITIDTLRPDALGWVAGTNATPVIDRLAREGLRYRNAVAPVPLTLPSHTSLMTGLLPRTHGVRDNGQSVAAGTATLAGAIRARGYTTAAFVSGFPLRHTFGLDSGFDHYDDRLPAGTEGWLERKASDTTAVAAAWIRKARAPWFVWVHYYDPHDPYDPPASFRRPGPRGAYDGEVAYVDSAIGDLLRRLPPAGTSGRVTVLAGDHGEGLGEHGESGHGFFLYDTTILVPLVFHAPGRLPARESPTAARLIDVAPTVLDLLHLPPLSRTDGRSLLPSLSGRGEDPGPAYLETQQPWLSFGWAPLSGLRDSGWKLIQAPRPELYDARSDPGEASNVIARHREKSVELLGKLQRIEAVPAADSVRTSDPETLAKLRSLGYLGTGTGSPASPRTLPDPKDRLSERAQLLRGEDLLRQGKYDEAVAAFAVVLRKEPGNRFALFRSGVALLKRGDLSAAVPFLENAVRQAPQDAESQFALADALTRTGQFAKAVPHWMETARLQPRRVAAWSNLGTVLGREGKVADAATSFERAIELEPKDPLLLSNLAFAERALGRDDRALAHLRAAAELSSPSRFPYAATLGLLYLKSGDTRLAADSFRRAGPRDVDYADGRFELAVIEFYAGDKTAARKDLQSALEAKPSLRSRAQAHPALASLLK